MISRLSACLAAGTGALIMAFAPGAFAHAPFDCSARVVVHEDFAEVMITVGPALAENYLGAAKINPGQIAQGRPVTLPAGLAVNFFTLAADTHELQSRAADVVTDGLEYQFHFEYPLSPGKSLHLESHFMGSLTPPRAAPLVMIDENGNVLASAILTEPKPSADFALPVKTFPSASNQVAIAAATTSRPAGSDAPAPPHPSFGEFLKLGISHILTGYDHLLFLAALLLGCRRLKTMLWVITGFTLAHSLTLALAALNLINLSSRLIEPAIAASIIFVAAENFRRAEKSWHRYALTCGFGLIHGFGFANALRDTGLAGHGLELAKPLLAFNLGVETGQLMVAAVALPLLLSLRKIPVFNRNGNAVISALIILVAAFWLCQRLAHPGR